MVLESNWHNIAFGHYNTKADRVALLIGPVAKFAYKCKSLRFDIDIIQLADLGSHSDSKRFVQL